LTFILKFHSICSAYYELTVDPKHSHPVKRFTVLQKPAILSKKPNLTFRQLPNVQIRSTTTFRQLPNVQIRSSATFRQLPNVQIRSTTSFRQLPNVPKQLFSCFRQLSTAFLCPKPGKLTENLITDLNNDHAADVATLGIDGWITELKANNDAFDAQMKSRYTEEAGKTQLRMKQVRVEVDKAYKTIVNRINALIIVNGARAYTAFVNELNERVDKYNLIIAQREGRNSKGDNPEPPKE